MAIRVVRLGSGCIPSPTVAAMAPFAVAALLAGVAVQSQPLPAAAPPVPYVDIGACPFEGCVYREWTANDSVAVRKDRRVTSPVVYSLRKGERVTALTGIVITVKAGRVQFRRKVALETSSGVLHIDPGQTLFLLTYQGEGSTKAWFDGRLYDWVDGSMAFFNDACRSAPPGAECDGKIVAKPESVWWVQVRNRAGQTGWTNQPQKFDGKDRFGG